MTTYQIAYFVCSNKMVQATCLAQLAKEIKEVVLNKPNQFILLNGYIYECDLCSLCQYSY
jgi:hypothetical protein